MHSMTSLMNAAAPLAAFTFVMAITPGPNNLMLLTSGARFGLRRTTAHLVGITLGFIGVMLIAYAGVGTVIAAYPALTDVLTVACVVYLLWLGYQLLRESWSADEAAPADAAVTTGGARPQTILQATLFQLVNPKGWGAAVTAAGIVTRDGLSPAISVLMLLGVTAIVSPPCTVVWALFGASLRPLLHRRAVRIGFSISMAVLILVTAWWMAQPLLAQRAPRV
jgi:threonine/homoserine/homoserine lactone efflux protein